MQLPGHQYIVELKSRGIDKCLYEIPRTDDLDALEDGVNNMTVDGVETSASYIKTFVGTQYFVGQMLR